LHDGLLDPETLSRFDSTSGLKKSDHSLLRGEGSLIRVCRLWADCVFGSAEIRSPRYAGVLVLTLSHRRCNAEVKGGDVGKHGGVMISWFLAAWLGCSIPIAAATLNNQTPALDIDTDDLPPSDLAGWFLTFDPSNQWTTQSNIATMESWLAVVEEIAADPSLGEEQYGVGMTDPTRPAVWAWVTSNDLPQGPQQDFVPEPATLGLLGGSLLTLGFCIRRRARRRNTHSTHVSLRRTD